jgi:hypothetical protein
MRAQDHGLPFGGPIPCYSRGNTHVYGERWPYARLFSLATAQVATLVASERHVAAFTWSPEGTELAYMPEQVPGVSGMERERTIERIS